MSYQVLARKYRPVYFEDMVGQPHIVQALIHGLQQGRLHHAYLFTGTRGVGKTTLARILARCLNCELGVVVRPCGQCSHCQAIAEGRFIDLVEIDAASRTKVEDTRDLLDQVPYLPQQGRYKVYLIDEVHMLSTHSFNALLKTLEEPPEHVKFILATTDPQKLPVTVLSRCMQFALKPIAVSGIVSQLEHVLQAEQIVYEAAALNIIAKAARGSMRDALSLTDQSIAFGGGQLTEAQVSDLLGAVGQEAMSMLLQALVDHNASDAINAVRAFADQNHAFERVLETLISLFHQMALVQVVPEQAEQDPFASRFASVIKPQWLQLLYQIALQARQDLPLAYDAQSGFEMMVLRMLAFKPFKKGAGPASAQGGDVPGSRPEVSLEHPVAPSASALPSSLSQYDPQSVLPDQYLGEGTAMSAGQWLEILEKLKLEGSIASVAMQSLPVRVEKDNWEIHTLAPSVLLELAAPAIEFSLRTYLGCPRLRVLVRHADPGRATPKQLLEEQRQREKDFLLEQVKNDDVVKFWIEHLEIEKNPELVMISPSSSRLH